MKVLKKAEVDEDARGCVFGSKNSVSEQHFSFDNEEQDF